MIPSPINSVSRLSNKTNGLMSFLIREHELIIFKSGLEDDTLADAKFEVALVDCYFSVQMFKTK